MTDAEKIDDGGPAFPNRGDNSPGHEIYDGMSLRDYYAGQAMAAYDLDTYIDDGRTVRSDGTCSPADWSGMAQDCYRIADAFLAERAKGTTP